jgi:hypothetical protein
MTCVAAVIGALKAHRPHNGEQIACAPLPVMRGWSAGASQGAGHGSGLLKQMLQRRRARPQQGSAGGGCDGFQIETAFAAEFGEGHLEQAIYFARDFLTDRVRSFFS